MTTNRFAGPLLLWSLLCLTIILAGRLEAQTGDIYGRVADSETGQLLAGANIYNASLGIGAASADDGRFAIAVGTINGGPTLAFGAILIPTVGLPATDGSIAPIDTEPNFRPLGDLAPAAEVSGYFEFSDPNSFSGEALVGCVTVWRDEAGRPYWADRYIEFDDLRAARNPPVSAISNAWLTERLESLRKQHFPSYWGSERE
ncbi:MAG: hypothetical protein IID15_04875 [Candidatus Marinimicrobia bacterium]|nr:hypothetical protein [Candidatus Neomarinimicrobiota bacterium]